VLKLWAGDKTGGSAPTTPVVGTGAVAHVGPGGPDTAVQWNDSGSFGGTGEFTFDDDTNSIICGSDSSITAADVSHCAIFCEFCESGDPA
jgi:hypothetical protein